MYRPDLDAVAGSLTLTALVAMLPLLTLFLLLGVLRIAAWKAALASLLISLLVAVVAYSMPAGQALVAGAEAPPSVSSRSCGSSSTRSGSTT